MAKKKPEEALPPALWKDTFSDLMNLLLCFFVLLFSMSSVDTAKFQELAASLSSAFSVLPAGGNAIESEGILVGSGASQLNELSEYYDNMGLNSEGERQLEEQSSSQSAQQQVAQEGLQQSEKMAEYIQNALQGTDALAQVEIDETSRYVVLSMNGGILFDSGKSELKPEAINILSKVADTLKVYDKNIISIEGHTDNVPMHSEKYPDNMILSLYRAYSVFDYFVNEKGFNEASISSSGRGEAVPIASNDTAEGRAQNRRVEIKIYNDINS